MDFINISTVSLLGKTRKRQKVQEIREKVQLESILIIRFNLYKVRLNIKRGSHPCSD